VPITRTSFSRQGRWIIASGVEVPHPCGSGPCKSENERCAGAEEGVVRSETAADGHVGRTPPTVHAGKNGVPARRESARVGQHATGPLFPRVDLGCGTLSQSELR
jgi:hypothetical protein